MQQYELPPPFPMDALGAYGALLGRQTQDPHRFTLLPPAPTRQHPPQQQTMGSSIGDLLDAEMQEEEDVPSTAPIDPTPTSTPHMATT
jgi:hypothetical protein